jgi:hypothetical protein
MGKKAQNSLKRQKFTCVVQYLALKKCKCLIWGICDKSMNVQAINIASCIKHSTHFL